MLAVLGVAEYEGYISPSLLWNLSDMVILTFAAVALVAAIALYYLRD